MHILLFYGVTLSYIIYHVDGLGHIPDFTHLLFSSSMSCPEGHPQPGWHCRVQMRSGLLQVAGHVRHCWNSWPAMWHTGVAAAWSRTSGKYRWNFNTSSSIIFTTIQFWSCAVSIQKKKKKKKQKQDILHKFIWTLTCMSIILLHVGIEWRTIQPYHTYLWLPCHPGGRTWHYTLHNNLPHTEHVERKDSWQTGMDQQSTAQNLDLWDTLDMQKDVQKLK